jgi:hypothetical protein
MAPTLSPQSGDCHTGSDLFSRVGELHRGAGDWTLDGYHEAGTWYAAYQPHRVRLLPDHADGAPLYPDPGRSQRRWWSSGSTRARPATARTRRTSTPCRATTARSCSRPTPVPTGRCWGCTLLRGRATLLGWDSNYWANGGTATQHQPPRAPVQAHPVRHEDHSTPTVWAPSSFYTNCGYIRTIGRGVGVACLRRQSAGARHDVLRHRCERGRVWRSAVPGWMVRSPGYRLSRTALVHLARWRTRPL